MINQLYVQSFKCFAETTIPLGPLTILSGLNGMGKSTTLQALLILKQTLDDNRNELILNGDLAKIGRLKDVASFFSNSDDLSIGVSIESQSLLFSIAFSGDEEGGWLLDGETIEGDAINLFKEKFNRLKYLSAERWGPRTSLPMTESEIQIQHVGIYGEYVAQFLAERGQFEIPNPHFPTHHTKTSRLLDGQTEAWLSEISPGVRLTAKSIGEIGSSYASYSYATDSGPTADFRATNVGFGISYALPVIVSILGASPGDTVIIENPEAHLHPAGQTAMGKMMAMAANAGVQVIAETHSDHFLDGARIAVKDGLITPDNVKCHFFGRSDNGESTFVTPELDKDGRLDAWPEGFFDQSVYNLAKLNAVT